MSDLLDELVEAAHYLASLGLSPGTTGNVSCREADTIFLSGSGTSLDSITRDQFATIRGEELSGPKPTKELPLHSKFYDLNPDATCVIHLHSPSAAAAACLAPWTDYSTLPPLSPYLVMKVGNIPLVPYEHPGSPTQAAGLSRIAYPFDSVLLQNHGSITCGTVSQAVERAIEIENASDVYIRLAGMDPRPLTPQQCDELARKSHRPWGEQDYRSR
jgi:L-fuculose-phosphate aldolase